MRASASREIDLSDRVVLLTGGASGIGLATAKLAAACGAQIAICDLKAANRDELQELGQQPLEMMADVSQEQDCDAAVAAVVERFGRLDVLVNNAGISQAPHGTLKQELPAWRHVIDVNLQGSFLMARAAARVMTNSTRAGSIVNVSSVTGLVGFRASNAYGVSKAAIAMLTQTMAIDLASRRIRVNAVAPGFVNTPMTGALRQDQGVDHSVVERRIPAGRFAEASEVAAAIVFLASDWASYITGAVLPVDGGWCAFGGPGDASIGRFPS